MMSRQIIIFNGGHFRSQGSYPRRRTIHGLGINRVPAIFLIVFLIVFVTIFPLSAWGQSAVVATPFRGVNEGFFESFSTAWGLRGKNWFFSFGGAPPTVGWPGAATPMGSGASLGFAFRHGNTTGYFHAHCAQGSSRSMVTSVPMLHLPKWGPGYFADVSISPFVMGFVPVVGLNTPGNPPLFVSPYAGGALTNTSRAFSYIEPPRVARAFRGREADTLAGDEDARLPAPEANRQGSISGSKEPDPQRHEGAGGTGSSNDSSKAAAGKAVASSSQSLPPAGFVSREGGLGGSGVESGLGGVRSSAETPAPSVAEAARLYRQEQIARQQEGLRWLREAERALQEGKQGVAKVYYQMAIRKLEGPLKDEALSRLAELDQATHKSNR